MSYQRICDMPNLYKQLFKQKDERELMNQQVQQILNATITTGQYVDQQGQNKKSYLTIGTLFIYADGGMSLKLDALPTNGQNINFYPRKAKEQPNQNNQQQNNNNQNNPNGGGNYQGQNQQYQGQ